MDEYTRESEAKGKDVVISEKDSCQSVLVKCIVLRILNDEEGTKGQTSAVFGAAVCFMGSGDAARY